ncbi:MAG: flagellar hook-associated protein 1 [Frankiales bacterium]|nr:flagellar hook-associated protein 1 [Frankiales bacterium]
MSFSSLSIGASALYAAQRAVEVAANNVANANNAGYTRQRVTIQSSVPTYGTAGLRGDGDRGTGVTVMDVSRLRDRLADVSYRSEAGVSGAASARSDTLGRAESVLGTYADGAPESLSNFITAWDQLSTNPSDAAARNSVLTAGKQIADTINGAQQQLDAVTHEVSLRVGDDVGELNGLLSSVASLNFEIVKAGSSERQPNDLLDQRDVALDRISTLTGARIDAQPDGSVNISIGSTALVSGITAQSLTASTTDPVTVSLGGSPLSVAGEIGGYVATAAVDLPSYRSQLDALAVGLRDVVNAVHRQGTGTDGSTGLDFFTGTDSSDFAVNPNLTPAGVAASQSGAAADGNNALAISGALRTTVAVNSQTIGDALNAFGAKIGQASADAARNAKTASASLTSAQATRASADGVSVDEEMVDLLKYQHSYEAASKVISIADGMLDTLINNMIR